MKKSILIVFAIICSAGLFAQRANLSQLAVIRQNGNWVKMLPHSRVAIDQFFTDFHIDLGLTENYHFELIKKTSDKLGFTHYRYQEYFGGYPIEGAIYILHEKDGFISTANGKLIRGIPENNQVVVSAMDGLNTAENSMNSEVFYWQIPQMEALIKRIKKDPNATFYPTPELVYAHNQYTSDGRQYSLAWKYVLYGSQPEAKQTIFVDASTGAILFSLNGIHSESVEGTAETRYSGTRTIITDSISPGEFRLYDATRGGGVETYNMNGNVDDYSLAVDFTDDDNYWNNANEEMDDAATDAHWGAEMFYDYFSQVFDRDSYDDNGSPLISYIHYDHNYFNAFASGLFTSFGDGDGNPLTSIDVVSHEFTHNITSNSAGLIYLNESGALNESFSDIFGTAVEFYALGEEADWMIGKADFILRDMSNPNAFLAPDTYQGDYWFAGSEDQGGVHTNSGVQNFWFYLLSSGGSGVNDNNNAYSVDSLGIETAAAIAYRSLTAYLTPESNYLDARYAAIQAAEDLFGPCSDIALDVAKAWYAVGVGSETITPDLQIVEGLAPLSGCDLGSEEQLSIRFRFNPVGCDLVLEPGDSIEMSYQINGQDSVVETLILSEPLLAGDSLTYNFQTTADFADPGQYTIDYGVNYSGDMTPTNNTTSEHDVTHSKTWEGDHKITFAHPNSLDSIYLDMGSNALGQRFVSSNDGGFFAYRMYSFGASSDNTIVPDSEDSDFTLNPNFVSRIYMCVDLSEWNEAYLNFDLRQTISPLHFDELGVDISYMIAARVTVNGQQIGEQYHPLTNISDPFTTHVLDLSAYAGTSFTLGFESVNFVNSNEDGFNNGDMALVANIFFSQADPTGLADEPSQKSENIYPNPSSGILNLETETKGLTTLRIVNLLGKTVLQKQFISNAGPYRLDVSTLAKGVYIVNIQSGETASVTKIVIE